MKVREFKGLEATTRAIPIFGDGTTPVRPHAFIWISASESHMLDDVVAKLRALDFGCSIHQAREVVGDTSAGDGAV